MSICQKNTRGAGGLEGREGEEGEEGGEEGEEGGGEEKAPLQLLRKKLLGVKNHHPFYHLLMTQSSKLAFKWILWHNIERESISLLVCHVGCFC